MKGPWTGLALLMTLAAVSAGVVPAAQAVSADIAPAAPRQEARVLPVDEAPEDPEFFAFRAALQRALAGRDTAALLAIVDPEIKLSFGGSWGLADFRAEWRPSDPDSPIWTELAAVLALGGRFRGEGRFVAPYTFTDSPDEVDPFAALIVIDASAPARAAPDPEAEPLVVLSFDVVRREWDPPATLDGWTAIRLADDRLAFIRSSSVRSPIDYRAFFERRDGRWRMTIFIAGD